MNMHPEELSRRWDALLLAFDRREPGTLVIGNLDGETGTEAIALLRQHVDREIWSQWQTDEGDCYFSTTSVALSLSVAGVTNWKLVTGQFGHGTLHCWLEYRNVAVNVSNPMSRPAYVIEREIYYAANGGVDMIQRIPLREIASRAKRVATNHGISMELDVRAFTKVLLRRTLYKASLADS